MKLDDAPVPNPVVVLREESDDWAILFNPDTSAAVGTNPVGVEIWKQADGTRSLRDIAATVARRFSNVPEGASGEVLSFADELARDGFFGVAEGAEG
ncbi:MAG: PqqD family peptide modification chaperone [Lentisphaerae bacterium]|nr:PqqD family peptide modification chaperone [Lentisphaerota bacterium]